MARADTTASASDAPVVRPKAPLPVVDVVLTPSMGLLRIGSTLHVAALALLPFAMQPGVAMAAIAAGIALSWWALRRSPALGFGAQALRRMSFHADGSVTVYRNGRNGLPARLLGSSLVTAALLLLRFELLAPGAAAAAPAPGGASDSGTDPGPPPGDGIGRRGAPGLLALLLRRLPPTRSATRAIGGDELEPDLLRRLRLRLALHREGEGRPQAPGSHA